MTDTITVEQVVQAARDLGKDEFTRADLASKLEVERPEIKDAFKAARKEGHLRKVRVDDDGKRHFRVA
jgi:DNA-binding transcriptional regulator LsrR (DeoR family)